MCKCSERRTKPIYSYHFVCTYPVPKPWSEVRAPLYALDESCVTEVYHLWYRMFAKAMNPHKYLHPENNSTEESTDIEMAEDEHEYVFVANNAANRVEW